MVCLHCGESIRATEPFERYINGPVAHKECFMRQAIGSVAHIERRCSCYVPGAFEGDDPRLTKRQAARAAVRAWYNHQERN